MLGCELRFELRDVGCELDSELGSDDGDTLGLELGFALCSKLGSELGSAIGFELGMLRHPRFTGLKTIILVLPQVNNTVFIKDRFGRMKPSKLLCLSERPLLINIEVKESGGGDTLDRYKTFKRLYERYQACIDVGCTLKIVAECYLCEVPKVLQLSNLRVGYNNNDMSISLVP